MGLFTRNQTSSQRIERLNDSTERAAVSGRSGKAQRLAARAERQRQALQQRTGRRWENYGRPVQD